MQRALEWVYNFPSGVRWRVWRFCLRRYVTFLILMGGKFMDKPSIHLYVWTMYAFIHFQLLVHVVHWFDLNSPKKHRLVGYYMLCEGAYSKSFLYVMDIILSFQEQFHCEFVSILIKTALNLYFLLPLQPWGLSTRLIVKRHYSILFSIPPVNLFLSDDSWSVLKTHLRRSFSLGRLLTVLVTPFFLLCQCINEKITSVASFCRGM